ncbi:MAG: hypothetical protein LBJ41_12000 [Treponema sp.]|jgi:hypothetical protein|nr:hypothetical protein [Treponema sp.]
MNRISSFLLAAFVLASCSNLSNKIAPEHHAQLVDGATTRGGFIITGPIQGGKHDWPFGAYFGNISDIGYIEEEYFIEGIAQHYQPLDKLTKDGKWSLEAISTAPYKTRILVRRPAESAKFNGIVVVEWANVSAGFEISLLDSPGLYNEGFAYVSVSAQMNGVYGFEENPQGLIHWDGERYDSLNIPHDGLSYDIFTQAARAIGKDRPKEGIDPMGGLDVQKVFAAGASQSGSRVLSYANGVQTIEHTFDAIAIIVNSGRGTDFDRAMAHIKENGETKVRTVLSKAREDINCKVFIINTQTESSALGGLAQRDTESICSWQVAGAAHFPPRSMAITSQKLERDRITSTAFSAPADALRAVEWPYIYEAALVLITKWIDDGTQPPKIPPLATINILFGYWKDAYGNAKGGVRLPEIEVPIAKYDISLMQGLGAKITPFTAKQLLKLYPSHQDYVDKVKAAALRMAELGIILPYVAEQYIREAETAPIPAPLEG